MERNLDLNQARIRLMRILLNYADRMHDQAVDAVVDDLISYLTTAMSGDEKERGKRNSTKINVS